MSRVIFLQRIWHEFQGPEIIAAVLKKHGHKTELFIGKCANAFRDNIKDNDIAAFSVMSGEHQWALATAARIKAAKNVLVIFGGPYPTYFPEIIRHPSVDIACRGEGEYAMLDIADAHEQKRPYETIPNLLVKCGTRIIANELRPLIAELDTLPFPERSIYYKYRLLKDSPLKIFMASRGCPFSCGFCFNEKLRSLYAGKGVYVRFRSPQRLIDEIRETGLRYGLRSLYFVDDLFSLDKDWLKEFTFLYKRQVQKPFVCSANINTLDEEIIALLKDAGCQAVSFGIETGNEALRQNLLNKSITNEQILQIGSLFKKYKLKAIAFNMLGLPGETVENALETIRLNIAMGVEYPRCSILTPYPGTRIAESFKDDIIKPDIDSRSQQCAISFRVESPREIYNLHCFFQTAVLFPGSLGLIKRLIKLPFGALFKLWWGVVYFSVFVRSEARGAWQTLVFVSRTFWPFRS